MKLARLSTLLLALAVAATAWGDVVIDPNKRPRPDPHALTERDIVWIAPSPEQVDWAQTVPGRPFPGGAATIKLQCRITEAAKLADCMAVSETPTGSKLTYWAFRRALIMSVQPKTRSGEPVAGRNLIFTIVFDKPEGD